jgi:hypothetical protein
MPYREAEEYCTKLVPPFPSKKLKEFMEDALFQNPATRLLPPSVALVPTEDSAEKVFEIDAL